MGTFDTIHVSNAVAADWHLNCRTCKRLLNTDCEWQTKSLDRCLLSYLLRHDDNGAIRLYLLDCPSDRRFWRAWTEQEIAASERLAQNERNRLFRLWEKKLGEGCFLPEAYLPQHRRQRFMGELPHQWMEIHSTCACKEYVQYWIKFSDGIAVEHRSESPTLEPGFFDHAGCFDL